MSEGWKNGLLLVLYSMAVGACLMLFSMIDGLIKYGFSLGAFLLGIRFFRTFERIGQRIGFVALSLVFYFVFIFIAVAVMVATGRMPLEEGVQA